MIRLALIVEQEKAFASLARSLDARVGQSDAFEHTLALWRRTNVQATLRFLDLLKSRRRT